MKRKDSELFDGWLGVLHTPEALTKITEVERALLQKISEAFPERVVSFEESIQADQAQDHSGFERYWAEDCATIKFALDEPERETFFAPLAGGRAFLEHIPRCQYCLLLLASDEMPKEVAKDVMAAVGDAFTQAKESGINVDIEGETLKEALRLPKKN